MKNVKQKKYLSTLQLEIMHEIQKIQKNNLQFYFTYLMIDIFQEQRS